MQQQVHGLSSSLKLGRFPWFLELLIFTSTNTWMKSLWFVFCIYIINCMPSWPMNDHVDCQRRNEPHINLDFQSIFEYKNVLCKYGGACAPFAYAFPYSQRPLNASAFVLCSLKRVGCRRMRGNWKLAELKLQMQMAPCFYHSKVLIHLFSPRENSICHTARKHRKSRYDESATNATAVVSNTASNIMIYLAFVVVFRSRRFGRRSIRCSNLIFFVVKIYILLP